MNRKPIVHLMVLVAVLGLLLGTSAAQEIDVILDENDNVIQILNLEVYLVNAEVTKLYNVEFTYGSAVDVFGDGENVGTNDFDFPSSNDTIFYARAAVNNALNANDTIPQGAGEQGTDDYFIPSIFANDLVVVAAGGENIAGAWSPCVEKCIDLDPDAGQPGQDPNINAGIALLSPVDNNTWADFTLVSEALPPPGGVLGGTTHLVKLSGANIEYVPESSLVKNSGRAVFPAVLRSTRSNGDTGGVDYSIKLLTDTGPGNECDEVTVGTLSTYIDENEALGILNAADFPGAGETLTARFFATVKTKAGATGFESKSGWYEIEDGTLPDPDQISKKLKATAKEKTPEKLGLQCTVSEP
jgi:hypothetical protein